jgi:tRNA modification GTPase
MTSNNYHLDDTIVAIASPKGGAARGIVRLSGPKTQLQNILEQVFDAERPPSTKSASITPGRLLLDSRERRAFVVPAELFHWPTSRSYTGEQVAEFHTIGSPPLLDATIRACRRHGARLAEPGEFTLRAFLSGRIDLTQAEAVAGIIDAEDPEELDTALDQLAGGLARPLRGLRTTMLDLLAHLEAGFDYADEDLTFIDRDTLAAGLQQCIKETEALLAQIQQRADTEDLVRVGLFGPSNVGKSSLFNTMTGDAHAIVSHHPGTTRDYLTATLDIDGIHFELVDTAGVDSELPPESSPDQAARQVSKTQAERIPIHLKCLDALSLLNEPEKYCLEKSTNHQKEELTVVTKADMLDADKKATLEEKCRSALGPDRVIFTSAVTHEGIKPLLTQVRDRVVAAASPGGTAVATTAARCEASLHSAAESLYRARHLTEESLGEELIAAELRLALESIGRVAGTVYTEEILEQVFRRFCVGK